MYIIIQINILGAAGMLRNFDMNLFIVLHALMEERSVTRTGERLGKTQSAISNALKRLREQFDDPLFVRTPGGLIPTPRAEELGRAAEEIMLTTQRSLSRAADLDPATSTAQFAIGAPDRLSLPVFLPFLGALARLAPGISIDLRTSDRDHAIRLIESQEIDLALGWFDQLPPRIMSSPAFSVELVCLCRPDHPIKDRRKPFDIDALLSFPHLVVSSGGDRKAAFDTMLARIGRERIARISLGNFTLVPSLLRQSDLIGVFTRRTASYFADHFALATHPLPFDIEPMSHQLIWHRRLDTDKVHRWVRGQLLRHCQP